MNQNFKLYSQYYDLLYKDKDYTAETNYLISLIEQYRPLSKSIIELGSGTGKHANLFAEKGYNILGLERSPEMVEIANRTQKKQVSFQLADITNFEVNQSFDIALSLFHVISYITNSQKLISTFKNVYNHLNADGLFIFDVWHTPAVHFQTPEKRTKMLQNKQIKVTRNANPIIDSEQNVVEVNYAIKVENITDGKTLNIEEKHSMRHFSQPELEILAYATGFKIIHTEEFFSKAPTSRYTWGVCYVMKKYNE